MRNALPAVDERLAAELSARLAPLRRLPLEKYENHVLQALRETTITEKAATPGTAATLNLAGEVIDVRFERPNLDFEPDGWDRVASTLSAVFTQLHTRANRIRVGLKVITEPVSTC